jgi:predicted dehydrogenase
MICMKSGVSGSVDLSWSSSVPSRSYLEIYGDGGTVCLDTEGISYRCTTWNEWKRVPNEGDGRAAFARQTDHFVEAIRTKRPTRLINEDGVDAQAAIEAAYESLKQHRRVGIQTLVSHSVSSKLVASTARS